MPSRETIPAELLRVIVCPNCKASLANSGDAALQCAGCGNRYPIVDGIPILLIDKAAKVT